MNPKDKIVDGKVGYHRLYELPKRNEKGEFTIRVFKGDEKIEFIAICLWSFSVVASIGLIDDYVPPFIDSGIVVSIILLLVNVISALIIWLVMEIFVFERMRIYTKGEIKSLDYHYDSDLLFLEQIREKAMEMSYTYEKGFSDSDKGIPGMPSYENFTVFSKQDLDTESIFPEHKIAVYQSNYYCAEGVSSKGRHICLNTNETNNEYVKMFCGKKEYDYCSTSLINPINSIVIVVVDELEPFLYNVLFRHHRNYLLFCVIARNNPGKIFIGTDLRLNQDRDYIDRIKDLMYLLDIKGYDDSYLHAHFGPNEVKHKGKRLYKRN